MASEKELNAIVSLLDKQAREYGYEYGINLQIARYCAWSCEVRITPKPNEHDTPDRSFVTFAVGGSTAREVLEQAAVDALSCFFDERARGLTEEKAAMEAEIATLRDQLPAPVLH